MCSPGPFGYVFGMTNETEAGRLRERAPKRQRNHLDDYHTRAHTHTHTHTSRFSVSQHVCNGVTERERERERERGVCVTRKLRTVQTQPRFTMGPRILLVSKRDAKGRDNLAAKRVIHM